MTKRQIANRQAKIKAELDKGNYSGWMGTSDFLSYDWKTFQNFCSGQIIIAIGEGAFNNAVHNVIRWSIAWEDYHSAKRALEKKYGLDKLASQI